ncbi:MAG: PrsW family intramembrane metalloprotease, partial [Bacteroidia bacterium]|nr:PrsW family intramembrane metalloprotease [Bacteroidia bacterium]
LGIGGITPYFSLYIYDLLKQAGFEENGKFLNDLLFSIFGIGLNEELSKLAGVIAVFLLLKKYINDPIDILIYSGLTALGFSLVENFNYFSNYGVRIISSRAFYSALEHIINTSVIVYGFFRFRVFNKGNPILNTITGLALAIGSHGLFDFFLIQQFLGPLTSYFSLLVYLVGINFWIEMLNNANNFSVYFDYHKIGFSTRVAYRLFYWYFLTLAIAFFNNGMTINLEFSIRTSFKSLLTDGFLFWIVIMRISRFKIFKRKYFKVTLALPFYITKNKDEDFKIPVLNIPVKIRGENQQEYFLTKYLGKNVRLFPLKGEKEDLHNSVAGSSINAVISDKILLYDDVIVYTLFIEDKLWIKPDKIFVLKPVMKTFAKLELNGVITALYGIKLDASDLDIKDLEIRELDFISWVKIQPDGI